MMRKNTLYRLPEFLEELHNESLQLHSFRCFAKKQEDQLILLDSILRGFPIGSILVCQNIIIDGKQRALTLLNAFKSDMVPAYLKSDMATAYFDLDTIKVTFDKPVSSNILPLNGMFDHSTFERNVENLESKKYKNIAYDLLSKFYNHCITMIVVETEDVELLFQRANGFSA